MRRSLTFVDELLSQTYTTVFIVRIHFIISVEREVVYVKVKVKVKVSVFRKRA